MRGTYLRGLSQELKLLPIKPAELEESCISKEEYKQNPEKYFVGDFESYNWDNDVSYGFYCWAQRLKYNVINSYNTKYKNKCLTQPD